MLPIVINTKLKLLLPMVRSSDAQKRERTKRERFISTAMTTAAAPPFWTISRTTRNMKQWLTCSTRCLTPLSTTKWSQQTKKRIKGHLQGEASSAGRTILPAGASLFDFRSWQAPGAHSRQPQQNLPQTADERRIRYDRFF